MPQDDLVSLLPRRKRLPIPPGEGGEDGSQIAEGELLMVRKTKQACREDIDYLFNEVEPLLRREIFRPDDGWMCMVNWGDVWIHYTRWLDIRGYSMGGLSVGIICFPCPDCGGKEDKGIDISIEIQEKKHGTLLLAELRKRESSLRKRLGGNFRYGCWRFPIHELLDEGDDPRIIASRASAYRNTLAPCLNGILSTELAC